MIQFRINGIIYDGFTEISCRKTMDTFCGQFYFIASTETQAFADYPIKQGQRVDIIVDGQIWMTAIIEVAMVEYNEDEMTVEMSGRDITADVVDSTAGPNISINGPIGLKELIERSLQQNDITGISVIDSVGNIEDFIETELIRPDIGVSLFDYLESYAKKRQVLLLTDNLGRINIVRGSGNRVNGDLRNKIGQFNNILSANARFDSTNRFNQYIVHAQANFSVLSWQGEGIEAATDRSGTARDTAIRRSRIKHLLAENPMNIAECRERANWEANIARARSNRYTCTIDGHSVNNVIVDINQLRDIDDDYAGINAQMLCSEVQLETNEKGNFASLTFLPKDAYTLAAESSQNQKNTNIVGLIWNEDNFQ